MKEIAHSLPFIKPYCEPVLFEWTGTLTASVSTDIPIQLSGAFAAMLVLVRASKAVASSAIRVFAPIGGAGNIELQTGVLDILDKAKRSIWGSGNNRPGYFRSVFPAIHGGGNQSTLLASYWLPFSENDNFASVLRYGLKSGTFIVDNDATLRLGLGATFSTGTFTVSVIGYSQREIEIFNGDIKQLM